jgi:hypothetical protein
MATRPPTSAITPRCRGWTWGAPGVGTHATAVVTRSLLIYGEGRGGRPLLHAVDKRTGEELATVELPGPTTTAPMTFMHLGRQYLISAVGGPTSWRGVRGAPAS